MLKVLLCVGCLLACLALAACGTDEKTDASGKASASGASAAPEAKAVAGATSDATSGATSGMKSGATSGATSGMKSGATSGTPPSESLPPLTEKEQERAEAIIDFYNAAGETLDGQYGQYADEVARNVRAYLKEWRLAERPRLRAGSREEARRRLTPPEGLLGMATSAAATQALDIMERALADMQRDYAALEKYSKDDSIQDDGALGDKLTMRMLEAHADVTLARRSWFEAVGAEATLAEQGLLRDHPLRRQILAGSTIFALFRRTGELLAPDEPDKATLEQVHRELQSALAEAGRPPFAAAPAVERTYRAYLKEVALFSTALEQGLGEGFHGRIRQELNNRVAGSREAYNLFVREANQPR